MKKRQEQRHRVAIGNVLLQDWDPIGVKHEPRAQDEYGSYIRTYYMGLSRSDKSRLMPIAEKLRAIYGA